MSLNIKAPLQQPHKISPFVLAAYCMQATQNKLFGKENMLFLLKPLKLI